MQMFAQEICSITVHLHLNRSQYQNPCRTQNSRAKAPMSFRSENLVIPRLRSSRGNPFLKRHDGLPHRFAPHNDSLNGMALGKSP